MAAVDLPVGPAHSSLALETKALFASRRDHANVLVT
jgi:hypothetical protein